MASTAQAWDLYCIGGPAGFYVGQAKHARRGGWERRVAIHRSGGRAGSKHASRLLAAGANAVLIGTVVAERGFVHVLEARAWAARRDAGWLPAHPRPRDGANWGGGAVSTEGRSRLRAAGKQLWESMTAKERRAFGRRRQKLRQCSTGLTAREAAVLGGQARHALPAAAKAVIGEKIRIAAKERWAGYSAAERRAIGRRMSENKRKKSSTAHRSAVAAQAGARGGHSRWHAQRGVSSPNCAMCAQKRG